MNQKPAFVFPGQGSQSIGMLSKLAGESPIVEEVFDEASKVLDYDLWRLTQTGPETELNRTDRTQPAMLAAGVAVWRAWEQGGGARPVMMAGHSLGEYTALVCAGALPFDSAIRLVAERGRYMQEAVPEGRGAMAAILGLEDERVIEACSHAAQGDIVAAVNFNSPGQVVIAGDTAAIERAMTLAREAGAKRVVKLPVSVPAHCALMKPAAERMRRLLDETPIATPSIPVLHNADVTAYDEPGDIRDALVRQLHSPVRWVETINRIRDNGATAIIECGPGKVLAGLCKRIDRDLKALTIYDPASLHEALGYRG